MDGSNKVDCRRSSNKDRRGLGFRKTRLIEFFLVLFACFWGPALGHGQEKKTVAVLPFEIHAPKPLGYLREGLQEMFSSRMKKYGFTVIEPSKVNKHPMASLPTFERRDIAAIGQGLHASFVITGSLTQVGKRISLDLTLTDMSGQKRPFSVFIVEDNIDMLPEAVDRASKSFYNQITGALQIDSIRVKGNQRIEKEAILAVIESKKGDVLNLDKLDKDLRAVYKMGFFKDVRIETEDGPRGKVVIFNVVEKPSIGKITFVGNKKVKDSDLRKESGIKLYSILNRSEIKQSINRLKEYYKQKGYYNVDIRDKIEEIPGNQVALTYEINEGEKVYIKKIEFVGNTKFDDDKLKDLMETGERGFFSRFTGSGLLDKKKLEFDVQKLAAFYHNHGYIKAKIGEPKISYKKGYGLTITIEVVEGKQYAVNKVKLEGELIKPEEELLKKIGITKEKFFNREVVRKDVMALREAYADEGYAYAEVRPYVSEDDKNHLVDITYKLSKGKKVRFERINITGNTSTRDKVIRRELRVAEGDYYNGDALRRSTRNLYRLGYFENVEVNTQKGSKDDLMVININVKERPTGFFTIGAGYSSSEKTTVMFQIAQNNLFGRGQKIQGSARLGSKTTEYDIRFTEPWLFDRRLSTEFDIYNWEREYDEYTKKSFGGALSFEFPLGLDEFTTGQVRYSYDRANITNIADTASWIIKDMEGKSVTSSMKLAIERDSKDRPWNTTRGSENKISFEYAGGPLGGDVYFNRYEATSGWFFPLPWSTVFMVQGRWGYIKKRSGGKLPVYQKYFLGGINTVRGFDYDSISPVDPATGDKIGGEKMMVYNVEYRFPLIKHQGVVGVVFFDAGNVFTEDQSYTFSGIRKSVGGGIRWYSPVGPLRMEYGINLNPKPNEPSGNWEFTIGGIF